MADTETNIAQDVLEAIAKAAAGKAGGWAVGMLLGQIFGDANQEIQDELNQIIQTQQEILQQLNDLSTLVVWETLQNEDFNAATLIQNSFQSFSDYASITDTQQRQPEIDGLVKDVLDLNSGIGLALTRIDDLACGNTEIQQGPGLLALCMQRAIADVQQNHTSVFLIDAFKSISACLNAIFHLQYQGTILLYNCNMQVGDTESAQQAVTSMQARLEKQLGIINGLTPKCLAFVAQMYRNPGSSLRTRIIPMGKPTDGIQTVDNESKGGPNIEPHTLQTDSSFYYNIAPTDSTCQKFYFYLVDDTAGDIIFCDRETGSTSLNWWSGVNRKSVGDWILLPCSDPNTLIIILDDKTVWTFKKHYNHFFSKAPDRIDLDKYADNTDTHFNLESMAPPPCFP